MPKEDPQYDLEDRLLDYAERVVRVVDALPDSLTGRHMAGQLLRCGTSPYANHGEAQAAESRNDFIHKLGVCYKEMRDSRRWLRLIHRLGLVEPARLDALLIEAEELTKIFAASIRTARGNK
jgi:four helix bundle protein